MSKKLNTYFYDISCKGISEPEFFEKQAKRAINEICQTVGWDNHTRISLEPVSAQKHTFSLSIHSETDGHPIVVTKQGKKISSLLRKAKKATIKMARDIQFKEMKKRRNTGHRGFVESVLWEAS